MKRINSIDVEAAMLSSLVAFSDSNPDPMHKLAKQLDREQKQLKKMGKDPYRRYGKKK